MVNRVRSSFPKGSHSATQTELKIIQKKHMADIRLGRDKAVAHHFRAENHNIENVGFKVLELITDKSRYYRQIPELVWIEKLNTEFPEGLNKKANLGVLWREYK